MSLFRGRETCGGVDSFHQPPEQSQVHLALEGTAASMGRTSRLRSWGTRSALMPNYPRCRRQKKPYRRNVLPKLHVSATNARVSQQERTVKPEKSSSKLRTVVYTCGVLFHEKSHNPPAYTFKMVHVHFSPYAPLELACLLPSLPLVCSAARQAFRRTPVVS